MNATYVITPYVARHAGPNKGAQFFRVLWLLSTRLGTLLLCGPACITADFPFVQRFADLPPRRVERILRGWLCHLLPPLRVLGRSLKGISMHVVVANASALRSTCAASHACIR